LAIDRRGAAVSPFELAGLVHNCFPLSILAGRRSKDYWKWRMLGVFHLFIFIGGISHIQAFLQVGRLSIFCYLFFFGTCTVVGVGLGCIYSWPLISLQVSTGVIAVYTLIPGLVLCH
jgi:hypothetical protein